MSGKLPLPKDFEAQNREKQIRDNKEFAEMFEGMSQKQVNLVVAALTNPTATKQDLAKLAGYKVPEGSKVQHLFKPLEGKLGKAFLHLGITEMDVINKVAELWNAKKKHIFKNKKIDKEGVISYDIKVVEEPDNAIQLKMLDMVLKLGDYFPAGKLKIDHNHEHKMGDNLDLLIQREKDLTGGIDADFEVLDETSIN